MGNQIIISFQYINISKYWNKVVWPVTSWHLIPEKRPRDVLTSGKIIVAPWQVPIPAGVLHLRLLYRMPNSCSRSHGKCSRLAQPCTSQTMERGRAVLATTGTHASSTPAHIHPFNYSLNSQTLHSFLNFLIFDLLKHWVTTNSIVCHKVLCCFLLYLSVARS